VLTASGRVQGTRSTRESRTEPERGGGGGGGGGGGWGGGVGGGGWGWGVGGGFVWGGVQRVTRGLSKVNWWGKVETQLSPVRENPGSKKRKMAEVNFGSQWSVMGFSVGTMCPPREGIVKIEKNIPVSGRGGAALARCWNLAPEVKKKVTRWGRTGGTSSAFDHRPVNERQKYARTGHQTGSGTRP